MRYAARGFWLLEGLTWGHWAERDVGAGEVRVVSARERGGYRVSIIAAAAEGLRRALRARQERRRPSPLPGADGRVG